MVVNSATNSVRLLRESNGVTVRRLSIAEGVAEFDDGEPYVFESVRRPLVQKEWEMFRDAASPHLKRVEDGDRSLLDFDDSLIYRVSLSDVDEMDQTRISAPDSTPIRSECQSAKVSLANLAAKEWFGSILLNIPRHIKVYVFEASVIDDSYTAPKARNSRSDDWSKVFSTGFPVEQIGQPAAM